MGAGSQSVTTNQSQQYTPNQPIKGMGEKAGAMATTAAEAPFQMPVAPVAGFTPFQNTGFAETLGAQGMAQPYFMQGSNYLAQSAQAPGPADIAQFYNPMANNVTAQLQNIYGQQMRETTGKNTQLAGGVGADRIGVAQANLANQQDLAAGQTYAGLYQNALQAAEQWKQMQAGAGYGLGQMGPAAQASQLQGIQALLGAGGQQQGLTQAQLNAIYQNQLAQIAYPFQTAQYLSGITAGLAPAMGGKTSGTATTTYPSPSPFAQIMGGATAGLGMLGGMGGTQGLSNTGMFNFMAPFGGGYEGANATAANPYNPFTGQYGFQHGGKVIDIRPQLEPADLRTALERSANLTRGAGASGYQEANPDAIAHGVRSGNISILPMGRQDGGGTDYGMLAKREQMHELGNILPSAEAGNPLAGTVLHDLGYQEGGDVPMGPTFPGASPPRIGGPTPIPSMQMQPGAGKSGPWGQFIMGLGQHQPQQGQGQSQSSDTSKAIGMAAQVLPMLAMMKAGGSINYKPWADENARGHGWPPTEEEFEERYGRSPSTDTEIKNYHGSPDRLPTQFLGPNRQVEEYQHVGARGGAVPFGYQEGGLTDAATMFPPDLPMPPPSDTAQAALPKDQSRMPMGADIPNAADAANIIPPGSFAGPHARPREAPPASPDILSRAAEVTGQQESGGDYGNVTTTRNHRGQLQSALGKYGIMDFNLAPWSAEVYGEPVSREDFLKNPQIQDAIYRHKMGQYLDRYGPEGAGRAWLGGEGSLNAPLTRDPFGTTVGGYGQKFASGLAGGEAAAPGAYPPSRHSENFYGREAAIGPPPYPDALQRDWGQRATRSPWMSLVAAGARMMQTRGPAGSVIGAGLEAGMGELAGQRKELRSEEDINTKAQRLEEIAQYHLSEAERKQERAADLADRGRERLEMARDKERAAEVGRPPNVNDIAKEVYNDPVWAGKPNIADEVQRRYQERLTMWRQAQGAPAGQGSTKETAEEDPGEGKRTKGHWYLVDGKPRLWT